MGAGMSRQESKMRDWGDGNIPAKRDPITQPAHYTKGRIEVLDAIMALGLDPCEANVVKYVCRHRMKGGIVDLKKAREYINLMILNHGEWYGDRSGDNS